MESRGVFSIRKAVFGAPFPSAIFASAIFIGDVLIDGPDLILCVFTGQVSCRGVHAAAHV